MTLPPKALRVLVMDERLERAHMLEQAILATGDHTIFHAKNSHGLMEAVLSFCPDIILIEVDSPTRDTLEQLTTVREVAPSPVVMFCQDQSYQTIDAAIRSGVSAYVTDGIDPGHVRPAIATAMATFQSFQSLRKELDQTKSNLKERKLTERAKGKLMRECGWSEEYAYDCMRQAAMDRKVKMTDIARSILSGNST